MTRTCLSPWSSLQICLGKSFTKVKDFQGPTVSVELNAREESYLSIILLVKNHRKSFLTKLYKNSLENWKAPANWSHWDNSPSSKSYVQYHIKTGDDIKSSFIVMTVKTELIQDLNSTITRRNITRVLIPKYPLYDKCRARTMHDMTPVSLMITET